MVFCCFGISMASYIAKLRAKKTAGSREKDGEKVTMAGGNGEGRDSGGLIPADDVEGNIVITHSTMQALLSKISSIESKVFYFVIYHVQASF